MRVGLQGQVRRVWASRGVKVVQKLQFVFQWRYLLLAVNPRSGEMRWQWLASMKQADLVPVLQAWSPDALIWDGAVSHRGQHVAQLPLKRIFLPPYSPELNPVERIFEEVRRHVEGRLYASLADKQAAVERFLQQLADDTPRVRQLVGWAWLCDALTNLPTEFTSSSH